MKKPLFILIDDDPVSLVLHRLMLLSVFVQEKVDIRSFTTARSGQLFLENLKRTSSFAIIVFLDLHMPEVSGWTFLEHNDRMLSDIGAEVFVLSSSIAQTDMDRVGTFQSTRSFIPKPLTQDSLKKELFEKVFRDDKLSSTEISENRPTLNIEKNVK